MTSLEDTIRATFAGAKSVLHEDETCDDSNERLQKCSRLYMDSLADTVRANGVGADSLRGEDEEELREEEFEYAVDDDMSERLQLQKFSGIFSQSVTVVLAARDLDVGVDAYWNGLNFSSPFAKKDGSVRTLLHHLLPKLLSLAQKNVWLVTDQLDNATSQMYDILSGHITDTVAALFGGSDPTDFQVRISLEPFVLTQQLLYDTQICSNMPVLLTNKGSNALKNLLIFLDRVLVDWQPLQFKFVLGLEARQLVTEPTSLLYTQLQQKVTANPQQYFLLFREDAGRLEQLGIDHDTVVALFEDFDCIFCARPLA